MNRKIKQTSAGKGWLRRKCKSRRGETLAEVLIGILFVAVASSLFLNMVTVSGQINAKTQKSDDTFYKAMSQLECFEADGELVHEKTGTVTVSVGEGAGDTQDYKVEYYYGDDMMSYQWTEDTR